MEEVVISHLGKVRSRSKHLSSIKDDDGKIRRYMEADRKSPTK